MFKEIEEPDFFRKKCFYIVNKNERFFYNEKTNQYYNLDNGIKYYFNENGWHRLDGFVSAGGSVWINGKSYSYNDFAEKTNHLICKVCNCFCRQRCFYV